jgi:hypothetical protein
VPRTVWIVSSGRTGTQFLARYFDANFEAVTARHEPPPRVRTRLVANAFAEGACRRERVLALLAGKKRRIDHLGAEIYVESNPFLWGAIGCLDEVFERPLVVHVVRDPREQIRSSLNHGTSTGWKALANRFVPYWYPSTPEDRGDWLERAAGVWAFANRFLRDAGAGCRDYRVFRYEDLFDATQSGLRALCAAIGVPFRGAGSPVEPSQRMNRAEREVLGPWRAWSDEQCAAVQRIAWPLMGEYGYGKEPEWLARVGGGA